MDDFKNEHGFEIIAKSLGIPYPGLEMQEEIAVAKQ